MTKSPIFQPEVNLFPRRRVYRNRRDAVAYLLVWYQYQQLAVLTDDNASSRGGVEVTLITETENRFHFGKIKRNSGDSILNSRPLQNFFYLFNLVSLQCRYGVADAQFLYKPGKESPRRNNPSPFLKQIYLILFYHLINIGN